MKQQERIMFDWELYQTGNYDVITRDWREATNLRKDERDVYPIEALVEGVYRTFTIGGLFWKDTECKFDLLLIPKQMSKARDKQVNGTHYKDMAIQPSEFIVKNGIGWYEGNAIKYICRHAKKGGKVDLEKAMHYIQLAIEEYYGE